MRTILLVLCCLWVPQALAVSGVNPFGVNVRSSGPTTIFLTFQALDPGERPVEAFWCGELQPAVMAANPNLQLPFAVQGSDPCLPGSVFGRLPVRFDQSQTSGSGGFTNLTDIMVLPASVARRAYQDARAGKNSAFFYVRHFTGGAGGDKYVIVTCRMAGGGARVPLALLDVRLAFETADGDAPVLVLPRGEVPPTFGARIFYNGSGTLKGRWEVVMPGDPEPDEDDLLTEATLPVEKRGLQRRYTLIERFERFLPPDGQVHLPGPDPALLPRDTDGSYKVLLRIEASADKEGDSNTGGGRIAHSGGVAGFPLPILRYHVGSAAALAELRAAGRMQTIGLFLPQDEAELEAADETRFSWVEPTGAALYQLEVEGAEGVVLSALVKPGVSGYAAPPWFGPDHAGQSLRWRVLGLDGRGQVMAASGWRRLGLRPQKP